MAKPKLGYAIGNSASTTLASGVTNTDTSFPLVSDTNFQSKSGAGLVIIDEGQPTEELAYATGVSGGALTIPLANRGLEGGSAQAHSAGATVRGVFSAGLYDDLVDSISNVLVASSGVADTTKIVTPTGTQALTNKDLTDSSNTFSIIESDLSLSDNTTANVSTSKHGLVPKAPNDTAQFLRGDGSWASVSGSSDGWTASSDTWTYASASTFTISGVDRTAIFTKGTKLKFTQTTAKYATVVSSSFSTDTTVTIAVNSDYTIANAAITSPNYSYQENPAGFPDWFTFATTYGGFSANPVPTNLRYSVHGRICYVKLTATGNGTSNATSLTITVPFAAAQSEKVHNAGRGVDNGSVLANPVQASLSSSSATVTFLKHDDSTWTNTGNKSVNFQFFFEI